METPRVAIMSLWRNDVDQFLEDRIDHLTSKTYENKRYIWVYGDCSDETPSKLNEAAVRLYRNGVDIELVEVNTGIPGESKRVVDPSRLTRLSITANSGLASVRPDDDFLIIHESDLRTPDDLIERFLDNAKNQRCPIAGWPVLNLEGSELFYDTWAYSYLSGRYFSNHEVRPNEPFVVRSFGSVAMMHAEDAREIRMSDNAFREICDKLRERGRILWCDPSITVTQPKELW